MSLRINKDTEEEKDKAKRQWTFVHSLLKSIAMNSMTTINYITFGKNVKIKLANDYDQFGAKRLYVACMQGLDDWVTEEPSRKGRADLFRKVGSVIFNIIDEDGVYLKLAQMMVDRYNGLNEQSAEKYGSLEEEMPLPYIFKYKVRKSKNPKEE